MFLRPHPKPRPALLTQDQSEEAAQQASLSRELSEFLIELSIGVNRYAMYPAGHPSHDPVLDNILRKLSELFVDRPSVSIGVAARQLIIEGMATDQKHPVLSDLAKRLHEHQLGALSFVRGVKPFEVAGLLEILAEESARGGTPIGMREGDDFPRWELLKVHPVGYEKLELKDDTGEEPSGELDRATTLWLGLAQAALASDEAFAAPPDATTIARTIEGHGRDEAYDQAVVGYMLQLTDELKYSTDGESSKVRTRVSKLMNELDQSTLQRLVTFGGNSEQRKKFVLDANQSLAVDAVLKVVTAAAATSEQTISSSMTRLLSKLAMHAGSGTGGIGSRSHADTALRENVESLMAGWELKDPNPEAYTTVLDAMATATPVFQKTDEIDAVTGPVRLVQMALEVDAYGRTISKAVQDMVAQGGTGDLMDMLEKCPEGNSAARTVKQYLTSPEQFRKLLGADELDIKAVRQLVDEMGASAVDPLLDVLADSESRSVRRRIFDVLGSLGSFVGQAAIARLDDSRWYVLRNLLALLQRLEHLPEDFDLKVYLSHEDHRVRREALPLAMRPGSALRDRSLVRALGDSDERLVRTALLQIQDGVPQATLSTLVQRVVAEPARSVEIRTMAIRCLENVHQPLASSALREIVASGKTLFGKPRLSAKSAVVLEALRILAMNWSGRPNVDELLELARKSRNLDIRRAARAAPPEG